MFPWWGWILTFFGIAYGSMGVVYFGQLAKNVAVAQFDDLVRKRTDHLLQTEGLDVMKVRELRLGRRFRVYEQLDARGEDVKELVFSHEKDNRTQVKHLVLQCVDSELIEEEEDSLVSIPLEEDGKSEDSGDSEAEIVKFQPSAEE